jgi:hypothetical protein
MELTAEKDQQFATNVIKNITDMFFTPEINRRKERGLLPEDFNLVAAQVIFGPDGSQPLIRLNQEVAAELKIKAGVDITTKDFWASSEEVESIQIYEKELANCGHATLIQLRDCAQLWFDFHYNKEICKDNLTTAEQFLQTAKFALKQNLIFAFIDNAFSTIELLAKTNLLLEANHGLRDSINHKAIKTAFNLRFKNSQTPFEIERRQVFNKLSLARAKARYVEGEVRFERIELVEALLTIEKMQEELLKRVKLAQ